MLKFTAYDYNEIRHHGEATYPHECCGILLGTFYADVRSVRSTIRCTNTRTDSLRNRYHIDPRELVSAQRKAQAGSFDIVGFYHSHPDHPARWSQTDFDQAHWIGCSYVITSVVKGKAILTNSFALIGSGEDDKALVDEEVIVEEASRH